MNTRGFTLIEVLVAVLVTGVLLSALLVTYQRGLVFWRVQADELEIRDHLRIGLDRAAREVRSAAVITEGSPEGCNGIEFRNTDGRLVRYYHDPEGRQLLRNVHGGANGVADYVDGFDVWCRPDGLVTMRLSGGLDEGKPVSIETSVWVRAAGD